jgi:hypothetical protein
MGGSSSSSRLRFCCDGEKNERGLGKGSLSLSLSLFLANIQKRQKGLKKGRFAAGSRTTTIQ